MPCRLHTAPFWVINPCYLVSLLERRTWAMHRSDTRLGMLCENVRGQKRQWRQPTPGAHIEAAPSSRRLPPRRSGEAPHQLLNEMIMKTGPVSVVLYIHRHSHTDFHSPPSLTHSQWICPNTPAVTFWRSRTPTQSVYMNLLLSPRNQIILPAADKKIVTLNATHEHANKCCIFISARLLNSAFTPSVLLLCLSPAIQVILWNNRDSSRKGQCFCNVARSPACVSCWHVGIFQG